MSAVTTMAPAAPAWLSSEHSTGTSIMAVQYEDGVVIGADSRTTTGTYIANRYTDKLTAVTDRIYCCRSGSAADTQAIADVVKYHLEFYEVQTGEPALVKTAANIFREMCYNYRDSLTAGIIVAGWDHKLGGQVYTVPIGGMCVRQPFSIGGSGSTYVYGYVDAAYKEGMSDKQCLEFTANTLSLAMGRDGSSGGLIRLASINKNGVQRHTLSGDQMPQFWHKS